MMGILTWVGIVIKVIPALMALITAAEELFDDIPESGAQKKELVMAAIKAMVSGIVGTTGWDEKLWAKIEKACSYMVDAACLFLFSHDEK